MNNPLPPFEEVTARMRQTHNISESEAQSHARRAFQIWENRENVIPIMREWAQETLWPTCFCTNSSRCAECIKKYGRL